MESSQIKAIIAGICFGIWPLMMNRGGLGGNVASLILTTVMLLFIFPFAVGSLNGLAQARWMIIIPAGIIGAIGILFFNGMLVKSTPTNVSSLFVTMIVVQTAIPVAYQIFVAGGMTITKGVGFGFAIVAAILLSK